MLQEKLESLQRQLHSTEKKLLSKELETEEKVTETLFFSAFSLLVSLDERKTVPLE